MPIERPPLSRLRGALGLALLASVLAAGPGCLNVTLARARRGDDIDAGAVRALQTGRPGLQDVLDSLGAPLEVHAHPDGMILVYRYRARNTFRFGIEAGASVQFLDVTRVVSSILENLRFTLERIHADEDRAVILIGRDGLVKGIGFRDPTKDLPLF